MIQNSSNYRIGVREIVNKLSIKFMQIKNKFVEPKLCNNAYLQNKQLAKLIQHLTFFKPK